MTNLEPADRGDLLLALQRSKFGGLAGELRAIVAPAVEAIVNRHVEAERTRWANKFAENAERAQDGLEVYLAELREQLAIKMLNSVDPRLPGNEVRAQCVHIVRGEA